MCSPPLRRLAARYLNIVGARVKIGDGLTRIALLWRDVLEAFMGLTERGLVTGVEAMVVDDFMTYIEDPFPFLGPFRTLRLCQRDRDRIHRRLRQLLADIASAEAYITDHGPCIFLESGVVNRAYLRLTDDGDAVNLVAYPADTLTQARALYPDKKLIKAFRVLADSKDSDGGPNFHFGFQSRGFCWTYGGIERDPYIDLWQQRIADGDGAVGREDWDRYWEELVASEVIDPESRAEFDTAFTATRRNSATPRPGLYIGRAWPIAEAEHLDDADLLAGEGKAELESLLRTLRGSIVTGGVES